MFSQEIPCCRPYTTQPRLLPLLLAFALALPTLVWADEDTLQTVVVVGQATSRIVDAETLEKVQALDLEDIFRLEPSVSVGGSLGMAQKIYVRGMEDTLLNVTVDGAPQTGTLFHHIGRVSVEPELLKQVEVQAGAGEATSGAGAVGGAIRFKTKKASEMLEPGDRFGAVLKGNYFSNDGAKGSASLYGKLNDHWGALASLVRVENNLREDGDGRTLLGTASEQDLGFIKLDGQLSDRQSLILSYEVREEEGEFGSKPNWAVRTADEVLYPVEAQRETLVMNYGFEANPLWSVELSAYQTQSEFEQNVYDRWGRYAAEMLTKGFDLRNTSLLGNHKLVYGLDYRKDHVSSRYLDAYQPDWDWAWDLNVLEFAEVGYVRGFYLQDHYRFWEPLLISIGARYDAYKFEQLSYGGVADNDGVSLNGGIEYSPLRNLTLSLGYAEAMRGKEVGDAFTLEHRPGRASLAPDIQPEEVANTELGMKYDSGVWRAKAAVYRTRIEKVILDQIGTAPPQDAIFYENIGELEIEGAEFNTGFSLGHFRLDLAFSHSVPELNGNPVEGYEHNGLANASGDKWVLRLEYIFSDRFDVGWISTRVEDLNDIAVLHRNVEVGWIESLQYVDKPGYSVHDLYFQWRPFGDESLRVNLAVQNLLDETYRSHSSVADYSHIPDYEGIVGINEPGRDIRLGISYAF
jgi:hemoglobin/transferrin/lactoferrin receptor protein